MKALRSATGMLVCAIFFGACSEESSDGSGSNLNEADGAAATGGSAGSSGGNGGASGSSGSSSGSSGSGGASGSGGSTTGASGSAGSSGGTAGTSGSSDAGDGGAACKWDGVSPRPDRDCIGDQYEYFGPGCRITWDHCVPFPSTGPVDVLPEEWVVDCRKEGANIVCDCLDNGRLVNTVPAPADMCPQRPPGPIDTPGKEVFDKFLPVSRTCLFCATPS